MTKEAREGAGKEASLAFEKAFIAKYKAELGITEATADAQKRKEKRMKKYQALTDEEFKAMEAPTEMDD